MRCCFIRVWANRIVHLEINEVDGFEWMVHNYDSFLRVTNSRWTSSAILRPSKAKLFEKQRDIFALTGRERERRVTVVPNSCSSFGTESPCFGAEGVSRPGGGGSFADRCTSLSLWLRATNRAAKKTLGVFLSKAIDSSSSRRTFRANISLYNSRLLLPNISSASVCFCESCEIWKTK